MKEILADSGQIKIHSHLIRQVVEIAASSVEGVACLAARHEKWLSKLMSRLNIKGIKLDLSKELKIEIPIIVKYGYNIPEVANNLQQAVLDNLSKSLNIDTAHIVVKVKGMKQ